MGRILGDSWPFYLSVHLLYYDRTTIARQLLASGLRIQRYILYWPTLEFGYILERATPYVHREAFAGNRVSLRIEPGTVGLQRPNNRHCQEGLERLE
jgi:hypothetical protein